MASQDKTDRDEVLAVAFLGARAYHNGIVLKRIPPPSTPGERPVPTHELRKSFDRGVLCGWGNRRGTVFCLGSGPEFGEQPDPAIGQGNGQRQLGGRPFLRMGARPVMPFAF